MKLSKDIIIIGGGISGLSLLHCLKQKYAGDKAVTIKLLEQKNRVGGTIESKIDDDILFEVGPNGFLSNKEKTLLFVQEIGLTSQLISSSIEAKERYVCVDNKLHKVPMSLGSFWEFKLLSLRDKLRLLKEPFIKTLSDSTETIYGFAQRRLGEGVAKYLLDPMVNGILAGDSKSINMKYAFPNMVKLEKEYGSLVKGFLKRKKQSKVVKNSSQLPVAGLYSFRQGMSELVNCLAITYESNIMYDQNVVDICRYQEEFRVRTSQKEYKAHQIFLCLPSFNAGKIVKSLDEDLSTALKKINYAKIAVVGLKYLKTAFSDVPRGFGYLNPNCENKSILGVLFESNVFDHRCAEGEILFRVMIGGALHEDVVNLPESELIQLAKDEILSVLKANQEPVKTLIKVWNKAIPQYDDEYVLLKDLIRNRISRHKNLTLHSNYWGGVSLNDCIENSYQIAGSLN